jgi:hypothetical protein
MESPLSIDLTLKSKTEYERQPEPSVRADALVVLNALKQAWFNYQYTGNKSELRSVVSTAIDSKEAKRLYIHRSGVFKDILNCIRSIFAGMGLTSAARFFQHWVKIDEDISVRALMRGMD